MARPLPPTLQKYVDCLAAADAPMEWSAIIAQCSPGRNFFWALKRRGLVEDVTPHYERGEIYTGPRLPKYVLSLKGKCYAPIKVPKVAWKAVPETLRDAMHRTGETDPYRADHLRRGGRF